MYATRPVPLAAVVVMVLLVPAAFGFLLGHHSTAPAAARVGGVAQTSQISLAYPPGWRRTTHIPVVPGLRLRSAVALAARDTPRTWLVAGIVTPDPVVGLPRALRSRLRTAPRADVVSFAGLDAYRYERLRVAGLDGPLTVYLIPSAPDIIPSTPDTVVVACRTASGPPARTCGGITASLGSYSALVGSDLTPSGAYGDAVSAALDRLEAARAQERRRLSFAAVPGAARRLAAVYGSTAVTLEALPTPNAAATTAAIIGSRLSEVRRAYLDLATAASGGVPSAYGRSRAAVAVAEQRVTAALELLGELGYSAPVS